MIPQQSWDAIVGGVSKLSAQDSRFAYDGSEKLRWVIEALLIEPEEAEDHFEKYVLPLGKLADLHPVITLESLSASESRVKAIVLDTVATWYEMMISRGFEDRASTQIYELSRRLGVWMDAAMIRFAFDLAGAYAPPAPGLLTNAEVIETAKRWALWQSVPWKSMLRLKDRAQEEGGTHPLTTAIWYLATNVTASEDLFGQLVDTYEVGSIIGVLASQRGGSSSFLQASNRKASNGEYAGVAADAIRRFSF